MKALWFGSATIYGYYVMHDLPWFPSILGGTNNGDAGLMNSGYPYQEYPKRWELRIYMLMQMGYHSFSLINHFIGKKKGDFMELLLHHFITLSLIFSAYLLNFLPIAGLISFSHDIPDFFLYFSRVFVDTKHKFMAISMFACLLISYLWGKLTVYPLWLIWHFIWYNNECPDKVPGFTLIGAMLHVLLILHWYWYLIFLEIARKLMVKGEITDRKCIDPNYEEVAKKDTSKSKRE
jgi:ceramide synthetase